jgi:hypothetical protein
MYPPWGEFKRMRDPKKYNFEKKFSALKKIFFLKKKLKSGLTKTRLKLVDFLCEF